MKKNICEKITAYINNQKTTQKILETPIKDDSELQSLELVILASILSDQLADEDTVGIWGLKDRMEKAGYNDIALSIGLRQLKQKGFISTAKESDFNGNECTTCQITENGTRYVLAHSDMFNFQQKPKNVSGYLKEVELDDLPF